MPNAYPKPDQLRQQEQSSPSKPPILGGSHEGFIPRHWLIRVGGLSSERSLHGVDLYGRPVSMGTMEAVARYERQPGGLEYLRDLPVIHSEPGPAR